MELNKVYNVDVLEGLRQLDDGSVDTVVTSPPYWALRDYGVEGQLGLEATFQEYLDKMLSIFDEVKKVLKPSGSIWVNMGDVYGGNNSGDMTKCLVGMPERFMLGMIDRGWILRNKIVWHKPNCMPSSARDRFTVDFESIYFFVKCKKYFFDMPREPHVRPDKQGEPVGESTYKESFGTSFEQGAHLKKGGISDWSKGKIREYNPLGRAGRAVWRITTQPFSEAHFATFPEELVVRCLKAGCPEFVCKRCGNPRTKIMEANNIPRNELPQHHPEYRPTSEKISGKSQLETNLTTGLIYKEVYYSNPKFVGWSDCGCKQGWEGGVVLDPFMGSGTVAVVARKLSRRFVGFDLNKEYVEMADKRIKPLMQQRKLGEVLQ